jgi:quinol monooxygenase YgiN
VAAVGVYFGWRGPLIPQFIGGSINVTFFMAALVQVMAKN